MSIKVHAFDPGVTTGYATGIIDDGKLGVVSGQAKWNEYEIYTQLRFSSPDIIVYERFEYRSNKAYHVDNVDLFPRNLIGAIHVYVYEREYLVKEGKTNGLEPVIVYTQMPAQVLGKMAYWTDKKLKDALVYKVSAPHANDAMRHLLYWWNYGSGYQYNTNGFEPLA